MNQNKLMLVFVLMLATLFSGFVGRQHQERTIQEIQFCDFKVPKDIAQGNASFGIAFMVQLGDSGSPTKITKVRNDFLSDAPFIECLKGWSFPDHKGSLLISFNWKHGEGWTEITISGSDMNQQIKIQPGAFSQYGNISYRP